MEIESFTSNFSFDDVVEDLLKIYSDFKINNQELIYLDSWKNILINRLQTINVNFQNQTSSNAIETRLNNVRKHYYDNDGDD